MATANTGQQNNNGQTGFRTVEVVLGAAAVIIFVYAMTLFLQGFFLGTQENEKAFKIYDAPVDEVLAAALADQKDKLGGDYRWVNRDEGIVSMPIEAAKVRLVEKLNDPVTVDAMEESQDSE